MWKYRIAALLTAFLLVLGGCGADPAAGQQGSGSSQEQSELTVVNTSEMFSDRDFEAGYDEGQSARIQLEGESAQCDSDAVLIDGGTVTITDEGTYLLSGTLEEGMIVVDAQDTDKVQLVLEGASVISSTSAALYIKEADKVFVTLAEGTENTLASSGDFSTQLSDDNIDGAVFSKADLTFNGAGSLTVQSAAGHGIVSKDDLKVTGGDYTVTAASHGLSGKDCVCIADGSFAIQSGKDGIQAENDEDAQLGYLYLSGGTFDIDAGGDALSGGSYLLIEDGTFDLTAGGGSAEIQRDQFAAQAEESTASAKGVKADGDLTIHAGSFTIDSADDGLHTNANLVVSGGQFTIATGDDGIHADENVLISDGSILITQSYEGIEGLSVDITGGEIDLVASDDGLNAAGGNDASGYGGFGGGFRGADVFAAEEGAYIHIAAGTLTIDASGDGIDSNGDLTVSGGETYISGPTDGGNSALDYNGEAVITGGVFAAAGSAQMAQNFGDGSTQGVMLLTFDTQEGGTALTLTDADGSELFTWAPEKSYGSVLISTPEIAQGSSYTLTAGAAAVDVTMDRRVYGSGMGGCGGGPGGRGGGRQTAPDAQQPAGGSDAGGTTPPKGQPDRAAQNPAGASAQAAG